MTFASSNSGVGRGPRSPSSSGTLIKRARATPPPGSSTHIAISSDGDAASSAQAGSTRPSISLWRTYAPNANYGLLASLTKAPLLDLQWSLVSPTRAHRGDINGVARVLAGAGELFATVSDDGSVRVWDPLNSKHPLSTFTLGVPVTGPRTAQLSTLAGHSDTPTSLALSPNGEFLLSPSLSSQTLVHDGTLLRGAWSKHDGGNLAGVGGADRMVCVWDVESARVVYKLPGHKGTVTAVDFPAEPIILTASKDGMMLLGELDARA
ncbi:WD40 repeat-like protein [Mycena rebaudengoi]|nr:WD40 repeat-like protein [Mycena rebaudengoi]